MSGDDCSASTWVHASHGSSQPPSLSFNVWGAVLRVAVGKQILARKQGCMQSSELHIRQKGGLWCMQHTREERLLLLAGSGQPQKAAGVMSALESLADWRELDNVSMARLLMGMSGEARTELRCNYATIMQGKSGSVAAAQL